MRLIGLISFYDEDPAMLASSVLSLAPIVDHLVCLDGRYRNLGATDEAESELPANSPPENYAAIMSMAADSGMGFALHRQPEPWQDNEVEKRSYLFRLGDAIAEEGDWLLVWDSDQVLVRSPDDLKERLEATDLNVAKVKFTEPGSAKADFGIRNLFRAGLGLHCETNHFTYRTADGRLLWGNEATQDLEPALDLEEEVLVRHLTNYRSKERHQLQHSYYNRRDRNGDELGQCDRCKVRPAVQQVPFDFEQVEVASHEGTALSASWRTVCRKCLPKVKHSNDKRIRSFGLDPDDLGVIAVEEKEAIRS